MTLRKPAGQFPPRLACVRPPIAVTIPLIAILLLITLANAPLALAQNASPADKPATTQVSSSINTPPRQRKRASWRIPKEVPKDVPKEAEVAAVPTPQSLTATPTLATAPQSAEDRLPFMANSETDSHDQPPSASGLLLRTLGALLLIVGLIVAAAWGMKRFGGARFGTPQENAPALAVLNSLSLGERRSLTIVRFGDRTLLLGSTAHAVTLLAEAETDEFSPHARSVADILSDEKPTLFSQELVSATAQLDEQLETRRGVHSIA